MDSPQHYQESYSGLSSKENSDDDSRSSMASSQDLEIDLED
jgi:hypothetical protein